MSEYIDYIDRQAVISAIKINFGISYDNPTLLESLIKIVQRIPSAQTWIPCCNRQPNMSGTYLITAKNGELETNKYDTTYGWLGWMICPVVAWQPLPKPWEGGQDGTL